MKRKQLSNRTFISMIVAIVLLVVMCAGATYAYFTDTITSDPKTLTFGEVGITLKKDASSNDGTTQLTAERFTANTGVTTASLMPGDKITFVGIVTNTDEAAFVRVSYSITFAAGVMNDELYENFTEEDWTIERTGTAGDYTYGNTASLVLYYALKSASGDGNASTASEATNTTYAKDGTFVSEISGDYKNILDIGKVIIVPTTIGNEAINTTVTLNLTVDAIQQANISMASGASGTTVGALTSHTDNAAVAWTVIEENETMNHPQPSNG